MCEVQVLVSLISSDVEVMPDSLACLAASAALAVSDIPIREVISEVRIGRVGGEMKINPTRSELAESDVEFIIAATSTNIMMVEGESKECQEEDLIKAIEIAHEAIKIQIKAQENLREKIGAKPKREYKKPHRNEELRAKINEIATEKMLQISSAASAKHYRANEFDNLKLELKEKLGELPEEDIPLINYYFDDLQYHIVRNMILNEKRRLDGRGTEDIRNLTMEADILPTPHGSALFTRGETQSLTTVTLGTPLDELLIESAAKSDYSKFILHYNFPPFSTGEVKPMRGVGRREVGHGNLAMRSLKKMMPGSDYPYTVRVVSDILESNGSSSMATVCAGSLALMDAGVPLAKHVGGIAMGLISKGDKFAILSDILGDEDHLGDMDFKITGTTDGICGVQMDIKVEEGLSMDVMRQALEQAKRGRLYILDAMYICVAAPRPDVKPHAPRMEKLIIDSEFIGAVIGPGGKIIQEIQKSTGATINITEVGKTGEVSIFSADKESLDKAVAWVKSIVAVPEVGDVYEAIVKSIKEFGAFVEFLPGKQGLLHISEIMWKRLDSMEGVLNEGDKVKVKIIGTDPKTGKFKLSRKILLPKPELPKPIVNQNTRRD
ncbi:MAG: polyribonucleotide nucleotidyltransferase [Parafilimonas sp.]